MSATNRNTVVFKKIFRQFVKKAMGQLQINKAVLASRLEMDVRQLSRYLTGDLNKMSAPTEEIYCQFLDALHKTHEEFVEFCIKSQQDASVQPAREHCMT